MNEKLKTKLLNLLEDLEEYMDNKSDVVDGVDGIPEPNREMTFLGRIQGVISEVEIDSSIQLIEK